MGVVTVAALLGIEDGVTAVGVALVLSTTYGTLGKGNVSRPEVTLLDRGGGNGDRRQGGKGDE